MPPDQLAVQMIEHIGDREVAFVGRHLRVEQHLQQQVAELFGQMRKVAPLDGVEDLVGLFERVYLRMVSNVCSRSHGQPPGARSRAMIATDCSNNLAARAGSVSKFMACCAASLFGL